MRLSDVLPDDAIRTVSNTTLDVTGITAASADVVPGNIFVAVPGVRLDGAHFIPDAILAGARVIICEPGKAIDLPSGITVIESHEPRRLLALAAARFAGRQPSVALAVTGTSGKTSVADFLRQILTRLGLAAASIGTIGIVKPSGAVYGSLTTPDPVTLHKTLATLAAEGVTHLAFEASSHGLDQHRLDGVALTAAAFTNLGRDHMDYHATVEDYLAAKVRLFTELLPDGGVAVINADGAYAGDVIRAIETRGGRRVVTVGRNGRDLRLDEVRRDGFQQVLHLTCHDGRHVVRLPLIGAYQVENVLVAAALAMAATVNQETAIFSALEHLVGVPGRLQVVGECNGGLAIIDYAHKPEALEAALAACRPFATGRLISVFGCGGDRDRGKRQIMGEISVRAADVTIITDDNPRTEKPAAIRRDILAGAKGAEEIGDRSAAIRHAVAMMQQGDVVLVAGKGHETGQIIGDTVVPFSDLEEIQSALQDMSDA